MEREEGLLKVSVLEEHDSQERQCSDKRGRGVGLHIDRERNSNGNGVGDGYRDWDVDRHSNGDQDVVGHGNRQNSGGGDGETGSSGGVGRVLGGAAGFSLARSRATAGTGCTRDSSSDSWCDRVSSVHLTAERHRKDTNSANVSASFVDIAVETSTKHVRTHTAKLSILVNGDHAKLIQSRKEARENSEADGSCEAWLSGSSVRLCSCEVQKNSFPGQVASRRGEGHIGLLHSENHSARAEGIRKESGKSVGCGCGDEGKWTVRHQSRDSDGWSDQGSYRLTDCGIRRSYRGRPNRG